MADDKYKIQKIDDYRWRIPREGKMRVDGIVYADEHMLKEIQKDESLQQVINVSYLPGIIGHSLAMPDIHWGYGFPIGGVAAFEYDEGVISPGGIGFDINCLARDSRVLSAHGYRIPIGAFEGRWRKTPLACVNPNHKTKATDVAAYMRFRSDVAYRVKTR